ncbi:MAG: hypothetical protein JW990_15415 [Thermoleophilia bacterium]|nr:hypothetical protein [Thermoleophilia bacterium]
MDPDDLDGREPLGLTDYFRVIRERWWVIAATVALVLIVTLVVSLTSTSQYRASTSLLYSKSNLEQVVFGVQLSTASGSSVDREVQTGALLVELEPVAARVKDALGSARSTASLLGMVSVRTETNKNVVEITAESDDPAEAAAVANEFAEQFRLFKQEADRAIVATVREQVKTELDQLSAEELASERGQNLSQKYDDLRIIESMQNGGYTIVQQATPPASPFAPQTTRNAIIALVLGLVLGVALAFLLDYLDKRIKDEKMLEAELGVPVLAGVPLMGKRRGRDADDPGAPVGFRNSPAMLEAFRTLRSSLEFFGLDKKQTVWLITSGMPQEGKSVTTANLGLSLALSGKRVVVLEADLRRPMVHEYLAIGQEPGLSNLLAGAKRMGDVLQFVKADRFMPEGSHNQAGGDQSAQLQRNIYAIASGPLPPNPAELLASERMTKLIKDLAGMTDCLLIDTAPVLAVSDALTVARHVDGVIVVTRIGEATKDQVREMRELFERSGTRVIGAVAMGVQRSPSYYRRQSYGYVYGPSV